MMAHEEDEISQGERARVMRQDADLRKRQEEAERQRIFLEGTTFHQHAQSAANDEAGGRFAAVNPATVVGSEPAVKYPQLPASSPWSGQAPEPGIEPPLGYDNPALDETSAASILAAAATGAPVSAAPPSAVQAPPLADDVETGTGAPPFSTEGSDDDAA
jgi:hypothetical protein